MERKGGPEGEWKLLFLACRRCADASSVLGSWDGPRRGKVAGAGNERRAAGEVTWPRAPWKSSPPCTARGPAPPDWDCGERCVPAARPSVLHPSAAFALSLTVLFSLM